jgi:hypothetical protein
MGQSSSLPTGPEIKGIRTERLTNNNYQKIIYPSKVINDQEQLQYIKDRILLKYDEPNIIDGQSIAYYIPKMTKLYHSSFIFDQKFNMDRITFFGIDIIISLWYLLEELLKPQYRNKRFGLIYEFEVIEDIPVYILEKISNHPYNSYGKGTICKSKQFACIHPQYAYHGNTNDFREMSMEITMNLSNPLFKSSIIPTIHPITKKEITYVIDMHVLEKMAEMGNYTFHQFNPIQPSKRKNLTVKQKSYFNSLDQNQKKRILKNNDEIKSSIMGMLTHINYMNQKKSNNNQKEGGMYHRILRKTRKTHFKSRK